MQNSVITLVPYIFIPAQWHENAFAKTPQAKYFEGMKMMNVMMKVNGDMKPMDADGQPDNGYTDDHQKEYKLYFGFLLQLFFYKIPVEAFVHLYFYLISKQIKQIAIFFG